MNTRPIQLTGDFPATRIRTMLHEQTFSIGTLRLNFVTGPEHGPPLLFFHGVTRRWQSFVPLIPALAPRWHLHLLDHRGHGKSGRANGDYLVTDYVRDAVAFIEQQFSEPVVLYGHSLGAMVAAAVAAAIPQQVRGVVLEDPPFGTMGSRISQTILLSYFAGVQLFAGSELPVQEIARQLAETRLSIPGQTMSVKLGDTRDPASLHFTARCLKQLDRDVLSPIVAGHWLDGFDWQALVAKVTCPTLLLQADSTAGGMLTEEDAVTTERLMANCCRVTLPNTGHLIHWLRTETCLQLVNSFLESLE